MAFNVAIDGPAGAGKSTIAKAVAKNRGLIYVDTGAMYRAVALYILRTGTNPEDTDAVSKVCVGADITIAYEEGIQVVYLNGENVNAFLRTEEVGNMASKTSAIPAVRAHLLNLQKNLAALNDCIMDGRDIGTVVLPDAQLKVFLTASSEVRAKRRFDELTAKGEQPDFDKIKADIEQRDYQDSHRAIAPLKQASDAVLVDSSDMNIEQVIARISELCDERA
ncbi:MAG: (d)CMP kinase [Lachnospiraceae bacterium]|nr:(d)CMP kinase [Lachnospiraceae bacterium]